MRLISEDALAEVTILQEAAGEPYASKVGIAEVILRRAKSRYESDGTIAGTVLHARQFSGWNGLMANGKPNVWRIACAKADTDDHVVQDCRRAWSEALGGSNTTNGALLYWNPKLVTPVWSDKVRIVATIGGHVYAIPL
jgi:N-acetylmuramoyl-L-alanine amidase